MSPELVHYLSAGVAVVLSSFGSAIGEGIAGHGAIEAMRRQPMGTHQNFRTLLIGLALTESGGILALVLSLMLLFTAPAVITWGIAWAHLGIACAIGLSALAVGICSSFAVKGACESVSRQPFFGQKITTIMLLMQSMIEASVIFAFIIALLIRAHITPDMTTYEGLKLTAAGCAIGFGAFGPSIGQAFFTYSASRSVGLNRKSYQNIFAFSLFNQAIIETPIIFCLLVATLLIYRPLSLAQPLYSLCSFSAAAVCMGLAALGTGIATGYVASRSCYQMARPGSQHSTIVRITLLAQVFIESAAIYALIISLLLIIRIG